MIIVAIERPPTIRFISLRFTFVALRFRSGVENFDGAEKVRSMLPFTPV